MPTWPSIELRLREEVGAYTRASGVKNRNEWIPAAAGMTSKNAGMTI